MRGQPRPVISNIPHHIIHRGNNKGVVFPGEDDYQFFLEIKYFLACLRYIEMNPLRAGIVENLEEYPWSSYRFRAYGEESKILDYDPWYEDLAKEGLMRQERYRKFFQEVIPEGVPIFPMSDLKRR